MAYILVMQKPGARDRIPLIEQFIKQQGGRIIKQKDVLADAGRISQHYADFKDKDFFQPMVNYYIGKTVRVWMVDVPDIASFRKAIGTANSVGVKGFRSELMGDRKAEIQKQFGVIDNGIHSSDSEEKGRQEIKLWFGIDVPPPNTPGTIPRQEWVRSRFAAWLEQRERQG